MGTEASEAIHQGGGVTAFKKGEPDPFELGIHFYVLKEPNIPGEARVSINLADLNRLLEMAGCRY